MEFKVARPALLVHGLSSDPTIWNNWLPKFNELGLNSVVLNNNEPIVVKTVPIMKVAGCGTIQDNAEGLKSEIDRIREELKVDKINLIGHSKGGLDSRFVAQEYEKYISQIIQIGTPNGGSEWADLPPSWLPDWARPCLEPITNQLRPVSMRTFNQSFFFPVTILNTLYSRGIILPHLLLFQETMILLYQLILLTL